MMKDRPRGNGIALIGYRGTGKSTVGRILASRLAIPFVDADVAFEDRFGRSIRSIFEELGEAAFRDYEEQVIRDLTSTRTGLISTGGGAILRESNRLALKRFGKVIWLTGDPEVLAARLGLDSKAVVDRPSLTSAGTLDEIAAVLEARKPHYQAASDLSISTHGRNPTEVAEAILEILSESWNNSEHSV